MIIAGMVVGIVLLSTAATAGARVAARPRTTAASCVVGHWKADLASLASQIHIPGTIVPSGAVDFSFSRSHDYLQVYSDTLTAPVPEPSGTLGVEIKHNGAVSAKYTVSATSLKLDGVDNATGTVTSQSVNGTTVGSRTTSPAFGSIAPGGAVSLPYTCHGTQMTITNTGGFVWTLSRTSRTP